jgi:hypothetical protein
LGGSFGVDQLDAQGAGGADDDPLGGLPVDGVEVGELGPGDLAQLVAGELGGAARVVGGDVDPVDADGLADLARVGRTASS